MQARSLLCAVCIVSLVVPCLQGEEPAAPKSSPALLLWEHGQEAMRLGKGDEAIDCYRRSLRLDPSLSQNYLSLAAAYLEREDDETAGPLLARYLEARPDHSIIRFHYAELLMRLELPARARTQLERFVADVQEMPDTATQHLINSHSRLMEIAQAAEDEYGEHLHRGIGLFLLGCVRLKLSEGPSELVSEALFCKAAAELTLARLERPGEARPCWYLHEVWSKLAQRQPAGRCLRAAEEAAPFSYLTPVEQRRLQMASRHFWSEAGKK